MAATLFSLLGLGSAAAGGFFDTWRWPLVGLTAVLLSVSLYYAFFRRPTRRNKIIFGAAVLVAAFATARPFLFL